MNLSLKALLPRAVSVSYSHTYDHEVRPSSVFYRINISTLVFSKWFTKDWKIFRLAPCHPDPHQVTAHWWVERCFRPRVLEVSDRYTLLTRSGGRRGESSMRRWEGLGVTDELVGLFPVGDVLHIKHYQLCECIMCNVYITDLFFINIRINFCLAFT